MKRQAEHEADDVATMAVSLIIMVRAVENLRHAMAVQEGFAETELKALARVSDAGEITPKDLSASLDITTGAVTAITDRLVSMGHLERIPNPADRRSLLLRATPTGREITARAYEGFRASIARAVGESPSEHIRELNELLGRVSASIVAGSDS